VKYAEKHISTKLEKASATKKKKEMISKLVLGLVFVALFCLASGFAVLVAWDVPVNQTQVEKAIDNSRFLEKSS